MCGIVGFIPKAGARVGDLLSLDRVKSALNIIHRRGPDNSGYFFNDDLFFGHTRLSILDLSDNGNQPMLCELSGNYIVYNGEIYNYIEVRDELKSKGYRFLTDTDTEVILKGYLEWGEKCVERFNGMWAFAVYCKNEERLFLSRDRIGEKPLYYAETNTAIYFSSDFRSFKALGLELQIDNSFLEAYFINLNVPAPYTFFKNIYQLNQGENAVFYNDKLSKRTYWKVPNPKKDDLIRDTNYVIKRFEELFSDSVLLRLRSDANFGCFLSGGLDSSTIVSSAARVIKGLSTYTVGFSDPRFDESNAASLVAQRYDTRHTKLDINPDFDEQVFKRIISAFGMPFADTSAIALMAISKEAKKYVKMVLTGDGGDEVLSGYRTYRKQLYLDKLNFVPNFLAMPTALGVNLLASTLQSQNLSSMSRQIGLLGKDFNEINLFNRIDPRNFKAIKKFLREEYPNTVQFSIEDYYESIISSTNINEPLYQLQQMHFRNDLPNDYLVKVDRGAMYHGLETRAPFLDYRLIEFMTNVDMRVKLSNGRLKNVLKKTQYFKELPEVIKKGSKKGFSVPLKELVINYKNSFKLRPEFDNFFKSILENGDRYDYRFLWSIILINEFYEDCNYID